MLFFGALPWHGPLSPRHNPLCLLLRGWGDPGGKGGPWPRGRVQTPAPLRPCHCLPPNILLWSSYSVLKLCPGESLKLPLYQNCEPLSRFTCAKASLESRESVGTRAPNKTQPIPPSLWLDFFSILFLGSFQWPVSWEYNWEGLCPLYRFPRNSGFGGKTSVLFCLGGMGCPKLSSLHILR